MGLIIMLVSLGCYKKSKPLLTKDSDDINSHKLPVELGLCVYFIFSYPQINPHK